MEDSATCGAQPAPAASRKGLNDLPIDVVAQALGLDIFKYSMADVLRTIEALQATPAPLADAELAELIELEVKASSIPWRQMGLCVLSANQCPILTAGGFNERDPALTAAMRNALPGLLARLAAVPKWITPAPALSQPRNLPKQDAKVLLELASGNYAVGQLTWAYRWLLQGGAVLLLQDVVRWQPIVGATVKGGQPHA